MMNCRHCDELNYTFAMLAGLADIEGLRSRQKEARVWVDIAELRKEVTQSLGISLQQVDRQIAELRDLGRVEVHESNRGVRRLLCCEPIKCSHQMEKAA